MCGEGDLLGRGLLVLCHPWIEDRDAHHPTGLTREMKDETHLSLYLAVSVASTG